MTFAKLADRVLRVTKGLKAEALQYLYEAQKDFILNAQVTQKTWQKKVTADSGTITAVSDNGGYASFSSIAHGRSVNDWVQVYSTASHNGLQQVTGVTDANTFVTDMAYVSSESGLTATFLYGFMFDLPSDYVDWVRVEWKGRKIDPSNQNDIDFMSQTDGFELNTGSAYTFWIEGDRIRLYPVPTDNSALIMAYTYYDTSASPANPIIPELYHQYLISYAIAVMLEVAGDEARANKYLTKYQNALDIVNVNQVLKFMS